MVPQSGYWLTRFFHPLKQEKYLLKDTKKEIDRILSIHGGLRVCDVMDDSSLMCIREESFTQSRHVSLHSLIQPSLRLSKPIPYTSNQGYIDQACHIGITQLVDCFGNLTKAMVFNYLNSK